MDEKTIKIKFKKKKKKRGEFSFHNQKKKKTKLMDVLTRNAQIQSPLDSQSERQILDFAHFPGNPSPYLLSSFDFFSYFKLGTDPELKKKIVGSNERL